jgi:protein-L-isoaspartate(D-aspartate) O-methyltransferase
MGAFNHFKAFEIGDNVVSMRLGTRTSPRGPEHLIEAVAAAGVRDERVLDALGRVPRASFVPAGFADRAYVDAPIRIPHDQVTTQPSLIAKMVEALDLRGHEKLFEVGTGYGFQTALLAQLARFVWSIERWPDIATTAAENLSRESIRNVEVLVGDGTAGLPEHAPFDAILVSAAFPSVVPPLADQLADGGRLVQPIGSGGSEDVSLFVKGPRGLARRKTVTEARFVRLYGSLGFRS